MPGDPVDRARVRLFLLNFEKGAVRACVHAGKPRAAKSNDKAAWKRRARTSVTA
jgi:RNA polymerase-associated protein